MATGYGRFPDRHQVEHQGHGQIYYSHPGAFAKPTVDLYEVTSPTMSSASKLPRAVHWRQPMRIQSPCDSSKRKPASVCQWRPQSRRRATDQDRSHPGRRRLTPVGVKHMAGRMTLLPCQPNRVVTCWAIALGTVQHIPLGFSSQVDRHVFGINQASGRQTDARHRHIGRQRGRDSQTPFRRTLRIHPGCVMRKQGCRVPVWTPCPTPPRWLARARRPPALNQGAGIVRIQARTPERHPDGTRGLTAKQMLSHLPLIAVRVRGRHPALISQGDDHLLPKASSCSSVRRKGTGVLPPDTTNKARSRVATFRSDTARQRWPIPAPDRWAWPRSGSPAWVAFQLTRQSE